jgi:hypothetical protein
MQSPNSKHDFLIELTESHSSSEVSKGTRAYHVYRLPALRGDDTLDQIERERLWLVACLECAGTSPLSVETTVRGRVLEVSVLLVDDDAEATSQTVLLALLKRTISIWMRTLTLPGRLFFKAD